MNLQELTDERVALAGQAQAILDKAAQEGRSELRSDEEANFDAIHADIAKKQGLIDRITKQNALSASEGRRSEHAQPEQRGSGNGSGRVSGNVTDWDRAEALRAWMLAGQEEAVISDAQRSAAQRCGINLGSPKLKLNLFSPSALRASNLRSPSSDDIAKWQGETRAALTGAQSTTTTGGYTVADGAMQALEVSLLAFGGMRQVSTIYRTATGGPLPFPTTNDTAQKGRLLSENTAATETEMTFGQLVIDAYKYSSDYVLASVEFLQDSSIDAGAFLGKALGERIARLQNDHFTTGTGSSQPNGIVTAAGNSSVTLSGTATISYDNVVDIIHSVDPAYRQNGRFMFHDGALKILKKVKVLQYSGDTTGVPLWQPSLVAGQPDLIHGYPYIVNQSMTTPATGVKSILFGDFSKYIIRDVRDVTLLRLDERFAELHQVAFLAFARSDGDLLDAGTDPVKYATQA
jgi:HK97 family phage major capsid protein